MGDFHRSYLDRRKQPGGTITDELHFLKGLDCGAIIPVNGAMGTSRRPQEDEARTPLYGEVSGLLRAWSDGDRGALDRLTPIVYNELHRLARRYMKRERPGHSLQTTALVNEAYMRLVDYKGMHWQNRAHFFAVSAQLMRRILVDHARRHNLKRGRGVQRVSLDETALLGGDRATDLVGLDNAMDALAQLDPRKVKVVEMRFFGGLSVEETAEVLKVSPLTVMRDWSTAKAWLYRELTNGTADGL
jgi:RNA polymerase sigma-70 factor, ECF subfamily